MKIVININHINIVYPVIMQFFNEKIQNEIEEIIPSFKEEISTEKC